MNTNTGVGFFNGSMYLAILVGLLLRWCISLHPYSGLGKPPMFGDYEAQRHWMEITYNLPVKDWYINTTDNDLMYWGLDYPPLTAYHSLLCGHAAHYVNPDFTYLRTSRGHESNEHKLFMRTTVLAADLLVYIPAILWFFSYKTSTLRKLSGIGNNLVQHKNDSVNNISLSVFVILIYPGLILIDYGHFQYNNISLGLFVAAVTALMRKKDLIGSSLFCLAVSYKQMELYHALPFFCYLLGSCLPKPNAQTFYSGVVKLLKIAFIVILTFIIVWLPFFKNLNLFVQVLHRLFPLARGVFEDKVANVWCSLNVLYKFRNTFSNESMARLCLISTVVAVTPSSVHLLFKPSLEKFIISLINSSLAFFLFSFQVHEKSILLAAVPVALYFHNDPLTCFWFLLVSVFSMLPLLMKDGLLIPTLALTVFFALAVYLAVDFNLQGDKNNLNQSVKSLNQIAQHRLVKRIEKPFVSLKSQSLPLSLNNSVQVVFCLSLLVCVLLTVCSVILKPPIQYPDLFPLLISMYSCIHFLIFFLYFNYVQIFTRQPTIHAGHT